MICSKLGVDTVVVTDNDVVSLDHMIHDAAKNGLDGGNSQSKTGTFKVKELDWFAPNLPALDILNHNSDEFKTYRITLLAGDVLYKDALLEPFFKVVVLIFKEIKTQGCYESSVLYLCHIPRAGKWFEIIIRHCAN